MLTFAQTVFDSISDLETAQCRFLRDPVCRGDRRLSLFRSAERCSEGRYCQPDIVMLFGPCVKVILEIDEAGEAGMSPKDLAGKPHAAAMCRYLIDPGTKATCTIVQEAVFVQIVNNLYLRPGSLKPEQYRFLESDLNAHLPKEGSIRSYSLLAGRPEDFIEGAQRERLRWIVKQAVFQYELLDRLVEETPPAPNAKSR